MGKNRINEEAWLVEFDIPQAAGQPDPAAGGPPATQPGVGQDPMAAEPQFNQTTPNPGQGGDISDDPEYPDMPEEKEENDFEVWKTKFVKESIKGDPNVMIEMIMSVRDRDLDAGQRKFVEDNLQICFLRQNSDLFQASTEVRKLIKKDFDRTYPATSVVNHVTATLDKTSHLTEAYIRTSGLSDAKGGAHRKLIAALIGAVQVGAGMDNEDLIFEESDYSIKISTRFNSRWGDVNLGRWFLHEDDPDRYLKEPEINRLEGGSPEEKDVLRRRVVIESISEFFKHRAFIINVVSSDGTVQHLGWDLGNSLKGAFLDGKLVVRTSDSDAKEAFIDHEGSIISIPNMSVYYVKESGDIDEKGKSGIEEIEFMRYREGMLYLSAQLPLLKEASVSIQGMVLKETPWTGNPSDLFRVQRCVPSLTEMIMRRC